MSDENPFEDIARQWMQMLQPPADATPAEKELAEMQASAYKLIMQGMQAFATGFSQRAVEHFRDAALQAAADTERIDSLEERVARLEAEIAKLSAKPSGTGKNAAQKSAAKPAAKKPARSSRKKPAGD
jgi:uncharacterized small protein (DUF1192 family)